MKGEPMYEALLKYAIPTMILIALVNFIWAWILSAVKPPAGSEEKTLPVPVNQEWTSLDAGPEGIRTMIPQRIKPKIKKG